MIWTIADTRNAAITVELTDATLTITDATGTPRTHDLDTVVEVWMYRHIRTKYNPERVVMRLAFEPGGKELLAARSEHEDEAAAFRELATDLHERLAARSTPPRFVTGMRSRVGYIFGVVVWLLIMGGFLTLVVFGTLKKKNYVTGVLFGIGILLIGRAFLGLMRAILRPSSYDPRSLPPSLLP